MRNHKAAIAVLLVAVTLLIATCTGFAFYDPAKHTGAVTLTEILGYQGFQFERANGEIFTMDISANHVIPQFNIGDHFADIEYVDAKGREQRYFIKAIRDKAVPVKAATAEQPTQSRVLYPESNGGWACSWVTTKP